MCIACGNPRCMEEAMVQHGVIATDTGLKRREGPPLAPKQRKTRGVPGYMKPVRLFDPRYPTIKFVQDEPVYEPRADLRKVPLAPAPEPEDRPRSGGRVRTAAARDTPPGHDTTGNPQTDAQEATQPAKKPPKTKQQINFEKSERRRKRKEAARAAANSQ